MDTLDGNGGARATPPRDGERAPETTDDLLSAATASAPMDLPFGEVDR